MRPDCLARAISGWRRIMVKASEYLSPRAWTTAMVRRVPSKSGSETVQLTAVIPEFDDGFHQSGAGITYRIDEGAAKRIDDDGSAVQRGDARRTGRGSGGQSRRNEQTGGCLEGRELEFPASEQVLFHDGEGETRVYHRASLSSGLPQASGQ